MLRGTRKEVGWCDTPYPSYINIYITYNECFVGLYYGLACIYSSNLHYRHCHMHMRTYVRHNHSHLALELVLVQGLCPDSPRPVLTDCRG